MFSGLSRTDYQDVLRAVGLFLDAHGYRNPRLLEQEDGVIIQALPGESYHYETILLSEEDLGQIISSGFSQRGTGPLSAAEVASLPRGRRLSHG